MGNTRLKRTAPPLLTLTGMGAAFGLASCCGLPFYFAALGIGTAWLGDIGIYTDFHRSIFIAVAIAGLIGGAVLLLWQRRTMKPLTFWLTAAGWLVGVGFLYLGLAYV